MALRPFAQIGYQSPTVAIPCMRFFCVFRASFRPSIAHHHDLDQQPPQAQQQQQPTTDNNNIKDDNKDKDKGDDDNNSDECWDTRYVFYICFILY